MRPLAQIACVLLLSICVLAQNKGIKPRSVPSDFPVSGQIDGLHIGAAQLSSTQVSHAFATDLRNGYIVVEVGVYPSSGEVALEPSNFFLRINGTKTVIRPASPKTIAAVLQRPSGRETTLYPMGSVGYESGHDIYGNRQSGVSTGIGLGVGISPKEQKSDADRKVMETELADKALPAGTFAKAVSGYLYFPVSSRNKEQYILEYNAGDTKLVFVLPEPSK